MKPLLCSDLDRTLVPNGHVPESGVARALLRTLVERQILDVCYVSGRSIPLIREAIDEFSLPTPQVVIGDVGATIADVNTDIDKPWLTWAAWHDHLAEDWQGRDAWALKDLLEPLTTRLNIRPQEDAHQNTFKLSYYTPNPFDKTQLELLEDDLQQRGFASRLIWSVDEAIDTGLLDVLPARASKFHAIEFFLAHHPLGQQHPPESVVFAGDSGNDLAALSSHLNAVLVANAAADVREQAQQEVADAQTLYLAKGDFLGMNGNYSAGVLEGLAHYHPEVRQMMQTLLADINT
jgi:HAD superfamily hydrolase (TIGR01484 family)